MTDQLIQFTSQDKKSAIERELKYRRRVYPRMIAEGKMTDGFANAQIAIFEDILRDYEDASASERFI